MGDGCARDWGAGTSIGGKKMSLHEKGDQTRALNHNSDFSARFRVDFSKFANVFFDAKMLGGPNGNSL